MMIIYVEKWVLNTHFWPIVKLLPDKVFCISVIYSLAIESCGCAEVRKFSLFGPALSFKLRFNAALDRIWYNIPLCTNASHSSYRNEHIH